DVKTGAGRRSARKAVTLPRLAVHRYHPCRLPRWLLPRRGNGAFTGSVDRPPPSRAERHIGVHREIEEDLKKLAATPPSRSCAAPSTPVPARRLHRRRGYSVDMLYSRAVV